MNEASKISKMLVDTISEALTKAMQNICIEIDEEEFLKMLRGYEGREQEIVRCKDCRRYFGNGYCNRSGIHLEVKDDWFCADGERRDEQNENNAEG